MNFLALTLALPVIGFLALLFLPRGSKASGTFALAISLLTFLSSLGLISAARANPTQFTATINPLWINSAGLQIHFHFGVDGINLWLVMLTTLLVPIGIWISRTMINERQGNFFALLLLFEFGLIGVFSALDLFAFYVFWDVALVPMYLMIGGWGGPNRARAAIKFFVYTMLGSVLMLGSIIFLHSQTGTFDYPETLRMMASGRVVLTPTQQLLLFLGFFGAFAVKVPIFPLHTWLPNAYFEAPMPATFLLSAVMSKMGAYGLIRYCLPLFPTAAQRCAHWIVVLAIIGILYGALIAMVQPNIKRLIAYSSLSHLGFIVLGIFTFSQQGADGAVFQMIAHGISTGALFLLAGYLEQRRGTLDIADLGGIATPAPRLATVFMIAMFASVGLPSLCNFIGEFLILQGAAIARFSWAVWAAIGVILSAAYMLPMYQRTFWGKFRGKLANGTDRSPTFADLNGREWIPLLPLLALMIWLGSYTQSFMPPITAATARMLDQTKINDEYSVQLTVPAQSRTKGAVAKILYAR